MICISVEIVNKELTQNSSIFGYYATTQNRCMDPSIKKKHNTVKSPESNINENKQNNQFMNRTIRSYESFDQNRIILFSQQLFVGYSL
jgi:hypothetical protein